MNFFKKNCQRKNQKEKRGETGLRIQSKQKILTWGTGVGSFPTLVNNFVFSTHF